MQRAQGFAQQGGEVVFTAGIASATQVQESFPFATITVFLSGTTIPAVLFSNNLSVPTAMSNPFTANSNGYWYFYAVNGRYDVMISAPGLGSWTIGDLLLNDTPGGGVVGSQTPWLSNIDGGGFNLSNVGFINVTGGYLINGVPLANPNLWVQVPNTANIYHQGFVGVANTAPAHALDVVGDVNVTGGYFVNGVAISTGGGNNPWIVLPGNHIQYNGQVGININPAHALDVVGDINITGQYFINGVAVGGGGGPQPWTVLTGSRINYNGQVGINNTNPGFSLDVIGSINVSVSYLVNGQPLAGGGGQWISGSGGVIFYNGGNVGIGTSNPTVALQVPGTVAVGQLSMATNPSIPVINSNGAFLGSGVDVTGLAPIPGPSGGIRCVDLTASQVGVAGPVSCIQTTGFTGALLAEGAIVSASASAATTGGAIALCGYYLQPLGQASPSVVINANGAFLGSGVDVTGLPPIAGPSGGIRCFDLTTNQVGCAGPISCIQTTGFEAALLAEGAIVSADASAATTGGAPANGSYYVQPLGQSPILVIDNLGNLHNGGILCASNGIWGGDGVQTQSDVFSGLFGIIAGGAAGAPTNLVGASGTFTQVTVWGGIVTSGTTGGAGSQTPWAQNINGNGFSLSNVNDINSTTLHNAGVLCASNGIWGGNGVQTASAIDGGNFGISNLMVVINGSGQFVGAGVQTSGVVSAGGFSVTGGSPGIDATVSWYGASSSGGPANVQHQLVFQHGLLVAVPF